MFSSFLYIVILAYQSFYSVSGDLYNLSVKNVNNAVVSKQFEQAKLHLNKLKKNVIFTNNEVESINQLIIIKSNSSQINSNSIYDFGDMEIDQILTRSILLDKTNKNEEANVLLTASIIDYPSSDTLVKFFELIKSQNNNPQVQLSKRSTYSKLNQWNENEALQLLELMKKNEKHLL